MRVCVHAFNVSFSHVQRSLNTHLHWFIHICSRLLLHYPILSTPFLHSGVFIYITFGQPHFRRRHLERPGVWTLEVQKIGEAFHYFVYVMRKHAIAEEVEEAAR